MGGLPLLVTSKSRLGAAEALAFIFMEKESVVPIFSPSENTETELSVCCKMLLQMTRLALLLFNFESKYES